MTMTAEEYFQKYGSIKRISPEQFNRYKGTEYYFVPRVVDGQKFVLGYHGWYPDTPSESRFHGDGWMIPFQAFCKAWTGYVIGAKEPVGKFLARFADEKMSMERYRAVMAQGTALPKCEHCHQTIL